MNSLGRFSKTEVSGHNPQILTILGRKASEKFLDLDPRLVILVEPGISRSINLGSLDSGAIVATLNIVPQLNLSLTTRS